MGTSIIIPAYNEEAGLPEVLQELRSLYDEDPGAEIIVVDDASTDRTAELVRECQEQWPNWMGRLKLCVHETNRGYGAALKTGLREAAYDMIVIIDGDGTYPVAQIPGLVRELESADMAVGARTGDVVHIPLVRRPAKWLLNALANYLTAQKIPDLNSGLRAIRREFLGKHLEILPDGFSFTTTLTMAALTNGSSVVFVPINYRARRGRSKIRPVRDTLNFISLILRTTIYFNPLKVFLPLSLCLLLMGSIILVASYLAGRILDATVSIIVMTAVQVLVLGLLADLVVRRSHH